MPIRQEPLLVIEPGRWPLLPYLGDVLHHRGMLIVLARRDIKLRYRQTILGVSWVVLQPILAAGILSFVFGKVAKLPTEGIPSFVYVFAGMLLFSVFSQTTSKATTSMITNTALVSKIFFPRVILPLASGVGVLLDFVVSLVVMALLLATSDLAPSFSALLLPVWVIAAFMLAQGIGCVLGGVSVRYRDIPQILPVGLQLTLYASPIAYSVAAVPERFHTLYYANPLAPLLEGARWSLLGTPAPTAGHLAYGLGCALVVFVAGIVIMEKTERTFADVI